VGAFVGGEEITLYLTVPLVEGEKVMAERINRLKKTALIGCCRMQKNIYDNEK